MVCECGVPPLKRGIPICRSPKRLRSLAVPSILVLLALVLSIAVSER